jgi:large subunit ribosomal protein L6
MSRIGKRPVELPNGVSLSINGRELSVKGPLGNLTQALLEGV